VNRIRLLHKELVIGVNGPSLENILTVKEAFSGNVPRNADALLYLLCGDLWTALGEKRNNGVYISVLYTVYGNYDVNIDN
jgi:hypothetical protein